MFGGYKFGDISKSVYNAVTTSTDTDNKTNDSEQQTAPTNPPNEQAKQQKGYQFGDLTKAAYQSTKSYYNEYQFGDISKFAYRSVSGQTVPRHVKVTNPIKEGFLHQKSELLLTYRAFWVVLQDKFLYVFKGPGKKQYDQCINAFDLTVYCKVECDLSSFQGSFYITSANDSQRFKARSKAIGEEWIQCITKVIGAHKLNEMKELVMAKEDTQDPMSVDVECIAYYIIDLEYTHQENGDPQTLLRNQNFIISSIIWSYIHEPDKQFDTGLVNHLDQDQQTSLKYWQQPAAVAYGMVGALKGGAVGLSSGVVGGLMAGVMATASPGDFQVGSIGGHNINMPKPAILPLSLIAGATIGTVYLMPQYAGIGFGEHYNQAKQ